MTVHTIGVRTDAPQIAERMNKCVFELEVETLEMEEKWSTSSFLRIQAKQGKSPHH